MDADLKFVFDSPFDLRGETVHHSSAEVVDVVAVLRTVVGDQSAALPRYAEVATIVVC